MWAAKTPREGAAAPGPQHSGTSVRPQSPAQCLFFKKGRNKKARRGFDKLLKNQIKSKNRVRRNGERPFLEFASPRGGLRVSPHPHLDLGPFLPVFHAGTLTPLAGQSPLSSPVHRGSCVFFGHSGGSSLDKVGGSLGLQRHSR